jgi:hypothetical protein
MQFIILSSLASIAYVGAVDVPCGEDEEVVRCQVTGTDVDALKKCYVTKHGGSTDTTNTKCGQSNAQDPYNTRIKIQDEINTKHCKGCRAKLACRIDQKEEICPFSKTTTADLKLELVKCFATGFVKNGGIYTNHIAYNHLPAGVAANAPYQKAIECGRADFYNEDIALKEINEKRCRVCVKDLTLPNPGYAAPWLKCPASTLATGCKFEEGKIEQNKKCFKKDSKGETECKKDDGENCEKCKVAGAAAHVGFFLAFAALLL